MPRDESRIAAAEISAEQSSAGPVRLEAFARNLSWTSQQAIKASIARAPRGRLSEALREEAGATDEDLAGLARRSAMLLISDLLLLGWDVRVGCSDDGSAGIEAPDVWLLPEGMSPDATKDAASLKKNVQAGLLAARNLQLHEQNVQKFIRSVEQRRRRAGKQGCVLDLVDDGEDLAAQLDEIAQLPESERAERLREVIDPELVLVDSDSRDDVTGLKMGDIWRYFRHTWSLVYKKTPARICRFMIRNRARPNRPVMGIACLTNPVYSMATRDRWIGWTTDALVARLDANPEGWGDMRRNLMEVLDDGESMLRTDDILAEAGDLEGEELEAAVRGVASAAKARRKESLKSGDASGEGNGGSTGQQLYTDAVDWQTESTTPLFVSKRADALADILSSRRILQGFSDESLRPSDLTAKRLEALRSGLSRALQESRKVGLSSRIMELNVCGAVPPYRDILGGKLVALAMASAEANAQYRARYDNQASEIASKCAGRAVYRSNEISLLTTTSLYGSGSSQYNRLKIPVRVGGEVKELRYNEIGKTGGWGTAHLSKETITALRAYSTTKRGHRNVNSVFGEGPSPLMRQVVEAVADLGIDRDSVLKHANERIFYAVELHENACEDLVFNRTRSASFYPLEAIADGWRERWLARRIGREAVLDRVRAQGPVSVSREVAGHFSDNRPDATTPSAQQLSFLG